MTCAAATASISTGYMPLRETIRF